MNTQPTVSQYTRMLENRYTTTIINNEEYIVVKLNASHSINVLRDDVNPYSKNLQIVFKDTLRFLINDEHIKGITFGYYYMFRWFIFIKVKNTTYKTSFLNSIFTSLAVSNINFQSIQYFKELPLLDTKVFTLTKTQIYEYLNLKTSFCCRRSLIDFVLNIQTTENKNNLFSKSFIQLTKDYSELYLKWLETINDDLKYGVFYFKDTQKFYTPTEHLGKHKVIDLLETFI